MNLESIASEALERVKALGVEKAQVLVNTSEIQELELTGSEVNLCRTNNDFEIRVKAVSGGRQTSVSANRWTEDSSALLLQDLQAGLEASQVDEAFDIYKSDVKKEFKGTKPELNLELALDRILEFSERVKKEYPKVGLRSLPFKAIQSRTLLANSHGLSLMQEESYYDYFTMFSGRDGDKTGSFNYISNTCKNVPTDFMSEVGLGDLFSFASREVDAVPYNEEVKGDILLTPFVLPSLMSFLLNQISTGSLISGSSLFEGKKGQKVVSDLFTLKSEPFGDRFATENPFSGEGILYEEGTIFENGVLKNYLLDVYGANKLKQPATSVSTSNGFIPAGEQSLKEMIGGIKKGLMLMRFSGGNPSPNGDFSGVAKNSFLIENGEITRPVKEVMVSGNLVQLFSNVNQVSREVINNGKSEFPWLKSTL